ncbi:MAG: TolC family protein [Bacteroidota bacterium]
MKRIIILLTVCAGAFNAVGQVSTSVSQPTGQGKVLTFTEAVKIAMKNSVLLNQQRNNLDLSQAQRVQSLAAIAPTVTGNAQAYRVDGNSFNNNTGTVVNGIRDAVTGSINANVNLFSGFNRQNQIKQYARALDAQSYFVNRTSQDVINTVSAQYLTVMRDVELVKIAKQNFDALDKQLTQVKEQVNLGGPLSCG